MTTLLGITFNSQRRNARTNAVSVTVLHLTRVAHGRSFAWAAPLAELQGHCWGRHDLKFVCDTECKMQAPAAHTAAITNTSVVASTTSNPTILTPAPITH